MLMACPLSSWTVKHGTSTCLFRYICLFLALFLSLPPSPFVSRFGRGSFGDSAAILHHESTKVPFMRYYNLFILSPDFVFYLFFFLSLFPCHIYIKLTRLIAFDKPDINTQHLEFEKRYKIVLKNTARRHPFVVSRFFMHLPPSLLLFLYRMEIVAMRMRCFDTNFLALILNTLIGDGAEGVIIRKKNTPYICGRSDLLWKLKVLTSRPPLSSSPPPPIL